MVRYKRISCDYIARVLQMLVGVLEDGTAAFFLERILLLINACDKRIIVFMLIYELYQLCYCLGHGQTLHLSFHPELFHHTFLLG